MAITVLSTGLKTVDPGTIGWNVAVTDSLVLLNGWITTLSPLFLATDIMGTATVADDATVVTDPNAISTSTLTDSSGGTPSTTIVAISGSGDDANINNDMASLLDQLAAAKIDEEEVRSKLIEAIDYCDALKAKVNELLAELRVTGGCGIIAD